MKPVDVLRYFEVPVPAATNGQTLEIRVSTESIIITNEPTEPQERKRSNIKAADCTHNNYLAGDKR